MRILIKNGYVIDPVTGREGQFDILTEDTKIVRVAEQITEKKLGELQKMLTNRKVELSVDTAAKLLVKEKGITTEFGAREIDRVIQNEIKPLLVDEILFGKLKKGGKCRLTASEGRFELEKLSTERKQIHGRTTAAT